MSEEEKKDEGGNGKAWSGGAVFGHIILAIFVPILGIIFGAVSLGKGGKRKKQGIAVLIIGIVILLIWLLIVIAIASGPSTTSYSDAMEKAGQKVEEQIEVEEEKEPERSQEEIAAEYLEKAKKAYDQENYEEALKHYTTLLEADRLDNAVSYYRYAYSDKQVNGADLDKYLTAYEMLQDEAPGHKYIGYAKNEIYSLAPELDYRKARLEDYGRNELLVFKGEIVQKVNEDGEIICMIATDWDEWMGYLGDNILVNFGKDARVIENDIVQGVGQYRGIIEYETVRGDTREIPLFNSDIFEVVKEE